MNNKKIFDINNSNNNNHNHDNVIVLMTVVISDIKFSIMDRNTFSGNLDRIVMIVMS